MAADIIDANGVLMLGVQGASEVDVNSTAAWIRVDTQGFMDHRVLVICFLDAGVDRQIKRYCIHAI